MFLFKAAGATPPALLVNLAHNKVLHETVLLLSIVTADVPNVAPDKRAEVDEIGPSIWQVILTFGYLDQPNVPVALSQLADGQLSFDMNDLTYFLGRETIIAAPLPNMALWREKLFVMQSRTAASAARFFYLPAERVLEVGTTIEI